MLIKFQILHVIVPFLKIIINNLIVRADYIVKALIQAVFVSTSVLDVIIMFVFVNFCIFLTKIFASCILNKFLMFSMLRLSAPSSTSTLLTDAGA